MLDMDREDTGRLGLASAGTSEAFADHTPTLPGMWWVPHSPITPEVEAPGLVLSPGTQLMGLPGAR